LHLLYLPMKKVTHLTIKGNEGKAVIADDQGNKWDIFGFPVSGPLQIPLEATQSFMGYWFAWGAFYPEPEIYGL